MFYSEYYLDGYLPHADVDRDWIVHITSPSGMLIAIRFNLM